MFIVGDDIYLLCFIVMTYTTLSMDRISMCFLGEILLLLMHESNII